MSENATESQKWDSKLPRFIALLLNWGLWFDLVYTFIHLRLSRSFKSTSMAASMSSSCYLSSLRLIPFKRTFFSSVNPPFKNLILRPIPSFLRAIVTFQKIPTVIVPPLLASSSSPSSSEATRDRQAIPIGAGAKGQVRPAPLERVIDFQLEEKKRIENDEEQQWVNGPSHQTNRIKNNKPNKTQSRADVSECTFPIGRFFRVTWTPSPLKIFNF